LVLSEVVDVLYKTTAPYSPADEHAIRWNDPELGVEWPLNGAPVLSPRDAVGRALRVSPTFDETPPGRGHA
jgi:dTDP-4-dehydrorhamnose 3,5-epimerase